jgi:hypothetical protein
MRRAVAPKQLPVAASPGRHSVLGYAPTTAASPFARWDSLVAGRAASSVRGVMVRTPCDPSRGEDQVNQADLGGEGMNMTPAAPLGAGEMAQPCGL